MSAADALHLMLHFLVPGLLARLVYADRWRRAWLLMVAANAVDADHLLADPIYQPARCSIGFHPLHTWPALVVYVLAVRARRTRLVGIGLVVHMVLDTVDCMRH